MGHMPCRAPQQTVITTFNLWLIMWYEETNIGKLQWNDMDAQHFNGAHYAQLGELTIEGIT